MTSDKKRASKAVTLVLVGSTLTSIEPAAVLLSSVPPVRGEITLFCVESNRQHMIWIVNLINMNYVTIRQLNQSCSMDSRYKNSYGRILVH